MASYYKSLQSIVEEDPNKWRDQIEAEKQVIRQNPQGYTPMSNQQLEGLANRYGVDTGTLYTGSKSGQYSPTGTSGADQWFNGTGTQDVIAGLQADYERYKAAGDVAGMNEAHTLAEQIRARNGYSGGTDGSMHISVLPYQEQAGIWNESLYGTQDPDYGKTMAELELKYGANYGSGGYGSQYGSQIDAMLNAVLNRGPFSYNKDEDPLYQQYKESYTRAGNRAMQDTLAQVSARTGGLASSYGTSASQQTYNNYMAQLADKVPELYQMAYDMYLDEIAQKRADLDMLMGVDNMYYGRHRDDVADQQWQQQFDYNAGRDAVADSQWQTQWNYGVQSDQQALAQSQIDAILAAGGTPSAELIQMAGYSNDYVGAMGNYYRQAATAAGSPKPVQSANYKAVLGKAKDYDEADDAYAYLNSMVNRGELTQTEADHIYHVELGFSGGYFGDTPDDAELVNEWTTEHAGSTATQVNVGGEWLSWEEIADRLGVDIFEKYDPTTGKVTYVKR